MQARRVLGVVRGTLRSRDSGCEIKSALAVMVIGLRRLQRPWVMAAANGKVAMNAATVVTMVRDGATRQPLTVLHAMGNSTSQRRSPHVEAVAYDM